MGTFLHRSSYNLLTTGSQGKEFKTGVQCPRSRVRITNGAVSFCSLYRSALCALDRRVYGGLASKCANRLPDMNNISNTMIKDYTFLHWLSHADSLHCLVYLVLCGDDGFWNICTHPDTIVYRAGGIFSVLCDLCPEDVCTRCLLPEAGVELSINLSQLMNSVLYYFRCLRMLSQCYSNVILMLSQCFPSSLIDIKLSE